LIGVAVNVQDVPEHAGFVPDVKAIVTEAVTDGFTVIVMAFEVAVGVDRHAELLVITHVTTSLLASDVELYVVPPVPTLLPFTFH
jgi:uncharacterized membrane protein YqgA involved in biofilm formation